MVKKKEKIILTIGKRKTAIARSSARAGTGRIFINSTPLSLWGTEPVRLWLKEPLILAGELPNKIDIDINVSSGGSMSQAEACRMAIAKSLVEFFNDKNLRNKYMEYDRNLLVYDARRTEPHKPSRSKAGSRRHKQRSKR